VSIETLNVPELDVPLRFYVAELPSRERVEAVVACDAAGSILERFPTRQAEIVGRGAGAGQLVRPATNEQPLRSMNLRWEAKLSAVVSARVTDTLKQARKPTDPNAA